MATVGTIDIRLRSLTADFDRGFKRANKVIRDFNRITSGMGRRIRTRVVPAIFAFQAATLGLAKSIISASSEAEQFRIRLNALLGSVEEAGKTFDDMADFAGRVPFEYREIMSSATALAGVMRGGRKEINQYMPIIADLAAVTGMGIQEVTGQIIRMYSAGAASADMFRERGILAMLGFQAGVKYTAEETRNMLIASWEDAASKFRGASDDLGKSWAGLMSMLSDRWFQFRETVGKAGLFDAAKRSAEDFLDLLSEAGRTGALDQFARSINAAVEVAVRGFGSIIGFIGAAINTLMQKPLIAEFGLIGAVFFGAKGAALFALLGAGVEELLDVIYGGVTGVEKLRRELRGVTENLPIIEARITHVNTVLARLSERGKEGGAQWKRYTRILQEAEEDFEEAQKRVNILSGALDFLSQNVAALPGDFLIQFAAILKNFSTEYTGLLDEVDKTGKTVTSAGTDVRGLSKEFTKAGKHITDDFVGALTDVAVASETAAQAFANFGEAVKRVLAELAVRAGLAAIATAIFGPAGGAFVMGTPTPKQHGGPVSAGQPLLVGEGGPELFVPRVTGQIVPSEQVSRTIQVNVFPRPLTMGEEDTWARKLKTILERV